MTKSSNIFWITTPLFLVDWVNSVTPVAQPQRRIPFHLRQKIENEIKKLEHDDIIEKIPENTPTEWVSPVVIVPLICG
jgi:hypothetical protein